MDFFAGNRIVDWTGIFIWRDSGGQEERSVAQTLVNKFGEKKAGIALGITGLVVGTTVFFEAGVVILIPLAFGLARKTKKSTLYYVIPLLAGLAAGFAFIPPISRLCTCCKYAQCGFGSYDCSGRSCWYSLFDFCRDFVVKIYRQPY